MRALVIQHDHVSPPGPVGDRLEERLVDVELHQVVPLEDFHEPGVPARFPDVTAYDAVVAMGAPWSVYDDARIGSWVQPELDLLRVADAEGIPVLGICFGGQLLSAAHGGRVEASPLSRDRLGHHRLRRPRPGAARPVVPVALRPLGAAAGRARGGAQRGRLAGVRAAAQPGRAVPSRADLGHAARLARQRRRRRGDPAGQGPGGRCTPPRSPRTRRPEPGPTPWSTRSSTGSRDRSLSASGAGPAAGRP